jgi:hypothetical protein
MKCFLIILAVATVSLSSDENRTGQNSNKQPDRHSPNSSSDPARIGREGNPAPRTGYHDRSTNTPGDYSGNHSAYPQPQRVYDRGTANQPSSNRSSSGPKSSSSGTTGGGSKGSSGSGGSSAHTAK